jgi:CHAT domain-containing protein
MDLPAARAEVNALSKQFIGRFLLGTEATEALFKSEAGEYAIIHLAMHGLMNTQYPILSSLAFSENSDSFEDNFLQAYEISQLKLNAQLVVLSACETGYGKFLQGEGVISLARSFMYAGVPSLVVSLWQVNDISTSTIMRLFYKNLAKGMDKAAALQQAKLEYIGGGTGDAISPISAAAHPAFWAAFVQLGDSRPIKVHQQRSGSYFIWASAFVAASLLLFTVLYLINSKGNNHNT